MFDELVGTVYEDDRQRIYWKNPVFEADYNGCNQNCQAVKSALHRTARMKIFGSFQHTVMSEPGEHIYQPEGEDTGVAIPYSGAAAARVAGL